MDDGMRVEAFCFDKVEHRKDSQGGYLNSYLLGDTEGYDACWMEARNYDLEGIDTWGFIYMRMEDGFPIDSNIYYGQTEESVCRLLIENAERLGLELRRNK